MMLFLNCVYRYSFISKLLKNEENALPLRLKSDDSPNDKDERELLALLEQGHPDAQERLYKAYYKRLLGTAWHVLDNLGR